MMATVSTSMYNSLGSVMTVTAICSFLFNGCGLMVFYGNKTLRTPTNMFIIALCMCDIIMSITSTIPTAACFYHGFVFNHSVCVFEGFMVYFLGLTSMYLLSAISVDRYVIIARPLQSCKITTRVAILSILICWTLGFIWSCLPMMGWNRYALEGIGVSCSVVWKSNDVGDISYIITIFIFCLLLPVAVMVFSYFSVYMTIRHINRKNMWDKHSRVGQKNMRLERKMFVTCAVMVSVFLLSWTPYAVVSFMSAFGQSHLVSPLVATVPALIAKLSGLWNPIIYILTNKQFRTAFYKMLPSSRLRSRLLAWDDKRNKRSDSRSKTLRYSKSHISSLPVSVRIPGISVLPSSRSINAPPVTEEAVEVLTSLSVNTSNSIQAWSGESINHKLDQSSSRTSVRNNDTIDKNKEIHEHIPTSGSDLNSEYIQPAGPCQACGEGSSVHHPVRIRATFKQGTRTSDTDCPYLEDNVTTLPHKTDLTLNNLTTPLNNQTTPLNNQTTPLNNLTTPFNNQTTPLNNLTTPFNNQTTPLNNLTRPLNNQTTPLNNLTTPFNNQTTPLKNLTTPLNNQTTPLNNQTTPLNNLTTPFNNETNSKEPNNEDSVGPKPNSRPSDPR